MIMNSMCQFQRISSRSGTGWTGISYYRKGEVDLYEVRLRLRTLKKSRGWTESSEQQEQEELGARWEKELENIGAKRERAVKKRRAARERR